MKQTIKKIGITIILTSLLLYSFPLYALTKDETVYIKLNNNGQPKNIFVNEHLKNTENKEELIDKTDLKNIININGKETYKLDGNNIIWSTNGNDIFYKGTTEKELPIKTEIKYYLNNEEKELEEILGKNGNIKIKIKFTNTDSHKTLINGKYETLYTPFLITSSLILNGTNNKNIIVDNGKVINNGINNIILAINTPGLYESLNIKELKNLDTLNIEFTTTKFELPNIYSVITPKVLDKEDLKIFDKLNSIYSETSLLKSSIDEIENASSLLFNASGKLNEGTEAIYQNLETVIKSLEALNTGAIKIDEGLKEIIKNLQGTKALLSSLNTEELKKLINANEQTINLLTQDSIKNKDLIELLTKNNEALTKINNLSTSLSPVINTLEIYLTELENGSKQISDGTLNLKNGVEILTEKTGELKTGMNSLLNGTQNLYNGIHTFNNEGITKINNLVNNEIKNTHKKINELIKLSESYDTFTMKNEDTESTTKFILHIEGKKQKETEIIIKKTKEETSLWTKFKNLFK